MSFLSRLKERLFKSSSKIEEGLESLVEIETTSEVSVASKKDKVPSLPSVDTENLEALSNISEDKLSNSSKRSQKKGFLKKFINRSDDVKRRRVDDEMLENLEDLLISADIGTETSIKISAAFSDNHFGRKLSVDEIKMHLRSEILEILRPVAQPISISSAGLQVILIVGVNGSGKTTTIGKLASQFKSVGKKVSIVAADTFRAAAVEQLEIWGKRAKVPVLKAKDGGDPAALVYDSIISGKENDFDIMMIDTAGRLQNNLGLMDELKKIFRVIQKVDKQSPQNTLLVLDASIGQNAINQVTEFQKTAEISGLVMTKLDGTAKGGILVALADRFKLPIHAIGIGEALDDLQPFDPEEFTSALLGYESR